MQADVRRPLYRGSQMVRALWFDTALLGETEARRRLLDGWESGARTWRLHGGYLLEWQRARRLQCERAPGLPFCDQDGILASAPLLAPERAGIAPGTAVLVLGAAVHAEALDAALRIDPSEWLDVSAVPVCVAAAMPAGPGNGFVQTVAAPAPDVRAVLGDAVPAPSADRAAFLRRAHQLRHGSESTPAGAAARMLGAAVKAGAFAAAAGLAGLAGIGAGLAGIGAGLAGLLPRAASGGMSGKGGTASGAGASGSAPLPSFLRDRLARLAMLTRVSTLLGWRQASYLRKLVRQFEQGDLDEALRHAIPLGGSGADERPAFGVPGRRNALDIGGPNASAASIGLAPDFLAFLRSTYQRSFDQLDRAGRIDEAAFVLAELMHRHQEAVDYLERKGRFAQAAQLAETLELASAVIVRLHCMAGNAERAVLVARLRGGFGEAVAELERRRHAAAPGLRLAWALDLAARGDLAEAAFAVWPLTDERERARGWLHAAEEAGGTLGVQGLVYKLALDPNPDQGTGAAVRGLLQGQDEEAARRRVRACACLLKLDTHNRATRRLASELWRRLMTDRAVSRKTMPREQLDKLLTLAADQVLIQDAPKGHPPSLPAPAPLQYRTEPLRVAFGERGLLALEDVRRLPDGGWLLALGEAGVAMARADGTELLRFPFPAHHLVLAHNGRHALALAHREQAMRVSRIDLVRRKASDWFSAGLDFWAREYDGASWNVVADERLMALDTGADGQSVLWQVRDLPGRIVAFDQQDDTQALLMTVDDVLEQWRYALPQRRLMGRNQCSVDRTVSSAMPDCANDLPTLVRFLDEDPAQKTAVLGLDFNAQANGCRVELRWTGDRPRVAGYGKLLLLRFEREDGAHCQLLDRDRILADMVLPEAFDARATLQDGHVLVWDRRGRVLEVEIATGAVRTVTFG